MNQNEIFSNSEGDAWFKRNQDNITSINSVFQSTDINYAVDVLTPFSERIHRILEIGCSNGIKLETLCLQLNAIGVGIDPSSLAVQKGNEREKKADITLLVGTGEKLPPLCADQSFDFVYFGFCLYLFDRNTLLQSLAEVDRVLKPGGFLMITDFDPGFKCKKPYKHFEDVFSYKQDYSSFYTESGLYYRMCKKSFSHGAPIFNELPSERISTNILYKETNSYILVD